MNSQLPPGTPSPDRIESIQRLVVSSMYPVRPLPSNRVLVSSVLGLFVLLAFICTLPFGWLGLHALSSGQKLLYFGLILLLAYVLGRAVVEDMIPGSLRRVNRPVLIGGAFPLAGAAVALLFPSFATVRFVHFGIPCLRLGLVCAAIGGLFLFLLLRRGFLTAPFQTCCLAGVLAGLVGFGGLAIHCPLLQASHILVWHLGAVFLAGMSGALVGSLLTRSNPPRL